MCETVPRNGRVVLQTRVGPLFQAAASAGKLDVLKWGEDSGYELDNILDEEAIADAALHGHLEVVKYLRQLGISWNMPLCCLEWSS